MKKELDLRKLKGGKIQKMNEEDGKKIVIGCIIAIFVIILIVTTFYTVPAGHRGVVMTMGKVNLESMNEGIHIKAPFIQTVKKFEIKTRKIEVSADASSADLQDVQTTIALNYHLKADSVPRLYQELGSDYQTRVIDPSIQESVKAVQAKYTAEELVTKRAEVRTEIQRFIDEKLDKFYIEVDDFNIINFQFSEEFDKAIEEKVTAEQKMLKAERDLERIIIEKEQIIATAQAEAESLRLQKQEITPDLIKLRQVEVQRSAVEKWDGVLPKITGGAIPFIQLDGNELTTKTTPTE